MTDYTPQHAGAFTDERQVTATNSGVPTQVANPSRASWRTYVQTAISYLVLVNIVLPIVSTYLAENVDGLQQVLGPLYGWIVIGVNFAILVFSLGAKLVAILMANPTVNALIVKYLPALAPIGK